MVGAGMRSTACLDRTQWVMIARRARLICSVSCSCSDFGVDKWPSALSRYQGSASGFITSDLCEDRNQAVLLTFVSANRKAPSSCVVIVDKDRSEGLARDLSPVARLNVGTGKSAAMPQLLRCTAKAFCTNKSCESNRPEFPLFPCLRALQRNEALQVAAHSQGLRPLQLQWPQAHSVSASTTTARTLARKVR